MSHSRESGSNPAETPESITDLLLPHLQKETRYAMERFRITWEKTNPPTDVTRYYTSMRPEKEQDVLYQLDSERYFKGLPDFAQDFLRQKMKSAASRGTLDLMPDTYLELFVSGKMTRGDRSR